jgi:type IV pilus assembly protein PilW
MNMRSHHSRFARQRGMGLIELMIGMTIGLIVLMALGYFFLGSQQANRTHNDISRMQESGRNALEILGGAIRQAGYRADADVAFAGTALTGVDGATDSITVQYDAQEGDETDCAGNLIDADAPSPGNLVTHAFAVNGSLQLTCQGQPMADNIEDMQITYGIDANKDGVIESYKAAPTAAEFPQVAAVRVNLVVRGPSARAATGGDGFLRQTYASTFTVRNQAR